MMIADWYTIVIIVSDFGQAGAPSMFHSLLDAL